MNSVICVSQCCYLVDIFSWHPSTARHFPLSDASFGVRVLFTEYIVLNNFQVDTWSNLFISKTRIVPIVQLVWMGLWRSKNSLSKFWIIMAELLPKGTPLASTLRAEWETETKGDLERKLWNLSLVVKSSILTLSTCSQTLQVLVQCNLIRYINDSFAFHL